MTDDPQGTADGALSLRRLVAGTPAAVWWLVVVQVCLGLLYGVAIPVLHGPDEYAHVDRVLGDPAPPEDPGVSDRAVEAGARVGLQPGQGPVIVPVRAEDVVTPAPAAARPPWEDLGTGASAIEVSQAFDHPATYYVGMSAVDAAMEAAAPADRWDRRIGRLRAVHAVLLGVLPWAAWWLGLRTARSRGVGLAAAIACLSLPMVAQTGAIVNNDAPIAALGALCLLALGWAATGDHGRATSVVAGITAGVATATKVFAVAAPAWFVTAAVGSRLDPATRRWPPVAWWLRSVAVALVFGAWWPLSRLLLEGTLAPRRYTYPILEDVEPRVLDWLGEVGRRIPETFVGSLGLEQFPPPWTVTLVVTGLLLGALAIGVAALRSRSLLLLVPTATSLVMMGYASWGAWTRSGLPSGLRGRYLLVGLVGLLVVAAVGVRRVARSDGAAAVSVAVVGIALHAVVLAGAVDGLWVGDGLLASTRTALAGAALGRGAALLVAVLAGAATAMAVRDGRRLVGAEPGVGQPDPGVDQPGSVSS